MAQNPYSTKQTEDQIQKALDKGQSSSRKIMHKARQAVQKDWNIQRANKTANQKKMEKNWKATKKKDIQKKKANQKAEKKTKKKTKAQETTKTKTTTTATTKETSTKKAQTIVKETKAPSLRDALPISWSLETSHKTTTRLLHENKKKMEIMEVIRMLSNFKFKSTLFVFLFLGGFRKRSFYEDLGKGSDTV